MSAVRRLCLTAFPRTARRCRAETPDTTETTRILIKVCKWVRFVHFCIRIIGSVVIAKPPYVSLPTMAGSKTDPPYYNVAPPHFGRDSC